jgi:four helix bundle protein
VEAGSGRREAGAARAAIRGYEDLEVYRRGMELLVPVHARVLSFPDYERFELASQLRRASKAIPANVAEGYGKKSSSKEFKAYLNHALGSANEVMVHLRIAEKLGYLANDDVAALIEEYSILAKQLYRLMQSWRHFDSQSPQDFSSPASRVSHPVVTRSLS